MERLSRALTLLLLASACAHLTPPPQPEATLGEGLASWYGKDFAGKKTASGKLFNPNELTAAHRTLPFGTCLKVERLDSGASVNVVVTDRGPYSGGRLLDLSEAAARKLGLIAAGVTRVRLSPCE